MSRLVLAGAGGFGREVFSWAHDVPGAAGPWRDIVFIDDNPDALAGVKFPAARISSIDDYVPADGDRVAITVGVPAAKRLISDRLTSHGASFETLRHPSAIIGASSEIGDGSIVCPGVVVTANARIGRFVALNVYATVGHDATVGDYSTLGGHSDVTGGATLEEGVFLGSHAVIAPGVRVGASALIGAGTAAIRNVERGATLLGVPGRNMGNFSGPGRSRA
ncbi:MAG TPA: NeuD/PglB/VioB family sugar acetyltransferase [Vicinamibacterales bacterium]|nr:NeuD/PglB/VioB family sugar acetyltransferase [Vicinamibacterales bacterium]